MSRFKLDGVLLAYAVEDVPDGGFEGFEIGVGLRPEPLIPDFTPERPDFVEVATVGGRVENIHVLGLPGIEPRLERGGVVDADVVEYQDSGPGPGGGPGIERVEDKGRVQAPFARGGVPLAAVLNRPSTLNR